jgi:hypothetical protein
MSKNAKVLMMFTVVVLGVMVAVYFYRRSKRVNTPSVPTQPSASGSIPESSAPPLDSTARYVRVTSY